MTGTDIIIASTFLPHDDPEASLAFYPDTLGFEVRLDVGRDKMRWITVGPTDQAATSIVLTPPRSSRSRPNSRTGFATARCVIRQAA